MPLYLQIKRRIDGQYNLWQKEWLERHWIDDRLDVRHSDQVIVEVAPDFQIARRIKEIAYETGKLVLVKDLPTLKKAA